MTGHSWAVPDDVDDRQVTIPGVEPAPAPRLVFSRLFTMCSGCGKKGEIRKGLNPSGWRGFQVDYWPKFGTTHTGKRVDPAGPFNTLYLRFCLTCQRRELHRGRPSRRRKRK